MITNEALRVLHASCAFLKGVDKQHDSAFANAGAKIGSTLRIRKPPKYVIRTGVTIDVQDSTETYVSLPVTSRAGVDMAFTSADLTLDIDQFSNRFIKPAVSVIASYIDYDALSMTLDVYNSVGTPGTTPANLQIWGDAAARLDRDLAPRDGNRMVVLDPDAQARTVYGNSTLFHAGDSIADQYRNGVMMDAIGFKWAMDQSIRTITCGTRSGSTVINDAAGDLNTAGTTTVSIDGYGAATQTVAEGEIFTIAGVYKVHPETKQTLSVLQQFTTLSSYTASGSSTTAVGVSPAMYTTGPFHNVSAFPSDGAAVTFVGSASTTYPQNLAFHRDAFTFATADLILPGGVDMASRKVMDGVSMRIIRQYDINNDNLPCRVEVLYGFVAQYPELACRVWG
jgi:hypothetical protein